MRAIRKFVRLQISVKSRTLCIPPRPERQISPFNPQQLVSRTSHELSPEHGDRSQQDQRCEFSSMASKTPAIAMKPTSAANTSGFAIQTSKEWVLPPRPKPGRKADTDNAPTKRKAQNREAQRAFRERRAARVGELEQQIRDIEAQHRTDLEGIEVENGRLKVDNIKLREAVDGLMRELSTIRSLTKLSQSPSHSMQTANLMQNHTSATLNVQQMASPAPSADLEIVGTQGSLTPSISPLRFDNLPEAYLGQSVPLRRKPRRQGHETPSFKRQKSCTPQRPSDIDAYEIEFTTSSFKPPMGELCGFCSDGTPCLCAEAAQQHAAAERKKAEESVTEEHDTCGFCSRDTPCLCTETANALVQMPLGDRSPGSLTVVTPMPTLLEEDNGLCTGNPGSCRQCQLDPMSTLFCRTLASTTPPAQREISDARPSLQQQSSTFSTSSARDTTPPATSAPGSSTQYVPCSAAYQTLSRHENFSGTDLSSIVRGLDVDRTNGRGVEVGSVRDVLRILDRGLGRDS